MKLSVALLLLAAVVASEASVLKSPASRSSLSAGYIATGDRLLYRTNIYKQAIPNGIQYEDVVYRGNATTRISAITATENVYPSQYSSAYIISGGIGASNVTVRLQSARGYGYYYIIDIWGR